MTGNKSLPNRATNNAQRLSGTHPESILVCLEDPNIRDLLSFTLKRHGWSSITLENGMLAKERIESGDTISAAILDFNLPLINGMQLVRMMRKREETAQIPILILSGNDHEENIIQAFENGVDDYLVLPFSPLELIARLKRRMEIMNATH